jgi:glycosyltransferase involved in cell wall biosynthesis
VSRVLLATDAFPPVCGGSGWSTWELARGLRDRGHEVLVVQPRPGQSEHARTEFDGFVVSEVASPASAIPFLRNYVKNERLWRSLSAYLATLITQDHVDIVHAQHVLTAPAAVRAGRATGRPVVCTVRDYWPVCYWGTLIHDPEAPELCPACTPGMMSRCVRPRAGGAWPLALPLIPYMRGNLGRKQDALADADAIIAVSRAIARDLRARSPRLADARMDVIPNPVNLQDLDAAARDTRPPLPGDYAVFMGKLEVNKGVQFLLPAADRAGLPWPLMVIGDGAQRPRLEADAKRLGRDVRFTGWLARGKALACLAHASLLIFPSYGPESLSRVLLEAAALNVPIAAMDTGGTSDIVKHEQTGLLASTPDELADNVQRLVTHRHVGRTLAAEARLLVERTFATPHVAERVERLYAELLQNRDRNHD